MQMHEMSNPLCFESGVLDPAEPKRWWFLTMPRKFDADVFQAARSRFRWVLGLRQQRGGDSELV